MKLISVEIENFHNIDKKKYEFKDLTYIYGSNGAGKSSVLEAIQLALLGYIPGFNKSNSKIYGHARNSNYPINVIVELNDGSNTIMIHRTWMKVKSSIVSDVHVTPETYPIDTLISDLELPIFNFNEFLSLTANKMKDWFLEFLPNSNVEIDWRSELQNSLQSNGIIFDDIVSKLIEDSIKQIKSQNKLGLEEIRSAETLFKSAQSFKKSELDRLQNTINSLIHYDDFECNETGIEIANKIKELNELLARAQRRDIIIGHNRSIIQEIDELKQDCTAEKYSEDARYMQFAEKLSQIVSKINEEESSNDYKDERSELMNAAVELRFKVNECKKLSESSGICPYTDTVCTSIIESSEVAKQSEEELTRKLEEIEAKLSDIESKILNKQSFLQSLLNKKSEIENAMKTLMNRYVRISDLERSLAVTPDEDRLLDVYQITTQIDDYRDKLVKLQANEEYNRMFRTITRDKLQVEKEFNIYKLWAKLCGVNGLQTNSISSSPFDQLSDAMNQDVQNIFESGKVKFNLENSANSFSFGVVFDGHYIPYEMLSSGEKCMFAIIMMINIVKLSKSSLKLMIADDIFDHLDNVNFNQIIDMIKHHLDVQMIFAGVSDPQFDSDETCMKLNLSIVK